MLKNKLIGKSASACKLSALLCFLSFVILVIPVNAQDPVLLVDASSPSLTPDGLTWGTAFQTIQDAIDNTDTTFYGARILVAEGIYFPTKDISGNLNPTDPRDKVIYLKHDVTLHGGYIGYNNGMSGNTNWLTPDGSFANTILSGDIGIQGDVLDNVYHILRVDDYLSGGTQKTFIDGFKVTGGYADGSSLANADVGGGLYVYNPDSPLKVENVIFCNNFAQGKGGAIFAVSNQMRIECAFCTFHNNSADIGGAIYIKDAPERLELGNCTFRENGVYPPPISGGITYPVAIPQKGGAIYLDNDCTIRASNVVLHDNAAQEGAAVYVLPNPNDPWGRNFRNIWRHCTFAFNIAKKPTKSATYYVVTDNLGNPADTDQYFMNTIFWDGEGAHQDIWLGKNIKAWMMSTNWDKDRNSPGLFNIDTGCMSVDPWFKDSINRNLRLNNVAGSLSPCLDAGSPGPWKIGKDIIDVDGDTIEYTQTLPLDMDCFSRVFYGIPDMGAYEISAIVYPR